MNKLGGVLAIFALSLLSTACSAEKDPQPGVAAAAEHAAVPSTSGAVRAVASDDGEVTVAWGRAPRAAAGPGRPARGQKKDARLDSRRASKRCGSDLLSHTASRAVPSAPKSLTSEFGMGSGVASSKSSPETLGRRSTWLPLWWERRVVQSCARGLVTRILRVKV